MLLNASTLSSRGIVLSFAGLLFLVWLLFPATPSTIKNNLFYTSSSHTSFESLTERQIAFWKSLLPVLESAAPNCPSPKRNGTTGAIGFDATNPPERPVRIEMPDTDILKMRDAHSQFLQRIEKSAELRPVYVPKTRGVVYAAGGKYLPIFVIGLRMLRRTGSKLPVELFLKDATEYEPSICNEVLPSLNAKCVVLSHILGSAVPNLTKVEVANYQLKVFAMLFSSFEEIVWIDADCFPLHKPEILLDAEPYKSTGMVIWPDFWISTVSPQYYLISQLPVPAIGLRASSETGEFLISKKNHHLTLLLATYYNYYGPSHYFSLLSQGAPGEGDKETFIQAASAAHEPFYTVSEPVQPVGHRKENGDIAGSAMVQYDPAEEYKALNQNPMQTHPHSNSLQPVTNPTRPRAFFIHAHFPKFNPATVFSNTSETKPTYKPDGSDGRAWLVAEDTIKRFGYDAEQAYWEEIKWVACNLEEQFQSWQGKTGICQRVTQYWTNVFEGEHPDDLKLWGV
ncbi:mannosyltransferase [Emydomyces testavorans]|uniref:Mannosyltransferase n=1 Tax=Emydomyces testavorans TaxID=2070801 RepID=A0AAF0IIN2_9EURO|nr:mannosyltransferase [Emydomyces testavorans]